MRIALVVALCVFAVAMTGCGYAGFYGAPVVPPPGAIYAEVSAPMTTHFDKTVVVTKSGSAFSESILGLVATGDCSLEAAARNGGITEINYADYTIYNILGVYSKFTVTVYGR